MDTVAKHRVSQVARVVRARMVNRSDRHGAYTSDGRPFTAGPLTDADLRRLVRGGRPVGVHAISRENTSRWVCLDVDRHDETVPVATVKAAHPLRL